MDVVTRRKIKEVIIQECLLPYNEMRIDNKESGIDEMMEMNRDQDLRRMFMLLSRFPLPLGLDLMSITFEGRIESLGTNMRKNMASLLRPGEITKKKTEKKTKMSGLVKNDKKEEGDEKKEEGGKKKERGAVKKKTITKKIYKTKSVSR
jgi:hypothetical protein